MEESSRKTNRFVGKCNFVIQGGANVGLQLFIWKLIQELVNNTKVKSLAHSQLHTYSCPTRHAEDILGCTGNGSQKRAGQQPATTRRSAEETLARDWVPSLPVHVRCALPGTAALWAAFFCFLTGNIAIWRRALEDTVPFFFLNPLQDLAQTSSNIFVHISAELKKSPS